MSKRLLYVLPLARYMQAHWIDRIRATIDAGYEVHIAVPFDAELTPALFRGAVLHDIPLHRGLPSLVAEPRCLLAIFRLLRGLRPDLVHAVTIRPVAYAGLAARLLRGPAVLHSLTGLGYLYSGEGPLARFMRWSAERLLRFVFGHDNAQVLFENPDDCALLVSRAVVPAAKTSVFIGSGLDLDVFSFCAAPETQPPLVVLPSRLIAPKGVHEFVAAARLLKAEGVSARFALVGEGDAGNPDSIAQATLDAWAREGAVECWGWQDDIVTVLRAASIVCLPSWYREGAPRILIEAAAIGRPAVTTDWPGCRDVVSDGVTGLLVPPHDVTALAEALRRLIADPALRRDMGLAARAHAESHFSNAKAVAHLHGLYADLLAKASHKI